MNNEVLRDKQNSMKKSINDNIYYIVVFALSLLILFVFPFLGSELGIAWNIPNTTAGWAIYIVSNVAQAACNVMIFHCFVQQGRTNSIDHPNFIEAERILAACTKKEKTPRSPGKFLGQSYGTKGTFVFLSTLTACIGLSSAIIKFDLVCLITAITMVVFGVIFGVLNMKKAELYWQFEYLEYAKYHSAKVAEEEKALELVKAESNGEKTVGDEKECSNMEIKNSAI